MDFRCRYAAICDLLGGIGGELASNRGVESKVSRSRCRGFRVLPLPTDILPSVCTGSVTSARRYSIAIASDLTSSSPTGQPQNFHRITPVMDNRIAQTDGVR